MTQEFYQEESIFLRNIPRVLEYQILCAYSWFLSFVYFVYQSIFFTPSMFSFNFFLLIFFCFDSHIPRNHVPLNVYMPFRLPDVVVYGFVYVWNPDIHSRPPDVAVYCFVGVLNLISTTIT
jgi:hypothetical protein